MKKLMIAAAIVCVAAMSHASAIQWSSKAASGAGGSLFGPDGSKELTVSGWTIGDAILMNAADLSQADMVANLRAGTYTFGTDALGTSAVNSKGVAQSTTPELTDLAGTKVNVYYAILATKGDEKAVLISSLFKDVAVPSNADATVPAKWGTDGHTFSAKNWGSATFSNDNAGWYSVGAVPEPTSGLLLLIGVAGLALRRRRA